jgi:divalent metal cation (Fe/Co/Zn/Cd) transporter
MDARRRGQLLEYATVGWNSLEAVVAVSTGLASHSLALVAFGLDSCIEVFSSAVVLWHLGRRSSHRSAAESTRALRLIALAFIVLGGYLAVQAIRGLVTRAHPDSSPVGTAFMGATVVVMFTLAWAKRKAGTALENRPLAADATMTFIDGFLASGVLLALILDRTAGLWWADPLAAGIVAVVALNEGREGWSSAG